MQSLQESKVLVPEDRILLTRIRGGVKRYLPAADVLLYGSTARGDRYEDSDYDILVLTDEPVLREDKESVREAMLDIELECGSVITTLFADKTEWNAAARGTMPFYREVSRDAILL